MFYKLRRNFIMANTTDAKFPLHEAAREGKRLSPRHTKAIYTLANHSTVSIAESLLNV